MNFNRRNIYLLYPPISKFERYSSEIGNAGGEQIPLGIYYLASYLRQFNYNVKVCDAESNKMNSARIIEDINKFQPAYVGISSTTVAFHRALEAAKEIKNNFPEIITILGGPHVSANPEHAMQYKEFDFGVLHEGEYTLVDLLDSLNNGKEHLNVKGIIFRNKDGKIIQNPKREYIEDLDSLPFPAYDLIEDISLYTPDPSNYKTLPVINMMTSRGCPNQCTFCDNNIFGRKYRQRSAENIAAEIKYLRKNFGVREIAFVDDTFLIDKKRLYKLFEILEEEKISIFWTCLSRINNTDYEFLKFLKSKGCWHISFGIESGDENILKLIKKNISLDKAVEVINWCKKLKIKTKGFFILGHPTETMETIEKSIKLACRLKLDNIIVTLNTPIAGSQQFEEAGRYGSLDKANWEEFNYWRPVFVPTGLTKEILLKKHREFYRRFYLRPRIIMQYFFSFFGKGGLKRFLTTFRASFYIFKKKSE